jgi:hypothetical protein
MTRRGNKIKLAYRATFQQPIGPLNPAGFKLATPIEVEIRRKGSTWAAFEITSGHQFKPITPQQRADTLQHQMSLFFAKQLTAWSVWRYDGDCYARVDPGEYQIDEHEQAWEVLKDA